MTDITDQDRRDARQWASRIGEETCVAFDDAKAAARVILATVDAPEPTLAEELRKVAADYDRDGYPEPDETYRHLADRAEQMEYARNTLEKQRGYWRDSAIQAVAERDEARAEVERLTADLKVALDKVDRLTAERNRIATGRYVTYAEVDGKPVQKGAESNAETPDPADVKPGEAWKANIWYDGVHQPGTAIKSAGSSDWVVIRDDGSRSTFRMNEYVELVSRLVPAPRVITNPDELDALPDDTIVRIDEGGDAMRKYKGKWHPTSNECCYESRHIALPATVLGEPEA